MIDFVEGTVAGKSQGEIVLNAGGVGFLLLCSNSTITVAPATGEKWRCYTVLNVREDAMELYGFASRQEREMFRRLCQVTGIGSKTALGVLSGIPLRELSMAIVTGDVNALSRVPGIGKKTAQRIILELKDKVEQDDLTGIPGSVSSIPNVSVGPVREAQEALMALGYTTAEAARAINLVRDQADTTDKLVMLALRQMGS